MQQNKKIQNAVSIITNRLNVILKAKPFVLMAIDGRSGSGKTTLAELLSNELNCVTVHADDFFLQDFQRTVERLSTAGENIDHERLKDEVILPLSLKGEASYRPFDCCTMSFKQAVHIPKCHAVIIEGSYSCHPDLWDYYDLKIFVTCDELIQKNRIISRNGNNADMFFSKWIPLEEKYFSAFDIERRCDLKFVL